MSPWKHSLSSQYKFGGQAEDYLELHRFLDSSKLFFHHLKHRALLHHLLGIEFCEELFGFAIQNSASRSVPVRDIAAQHIREDLNGILPSINDWFQDSEAPICEKLVVPEFSDPRLEEFVLKPWLRSGLKSSLLITCSHFGVALARRILGWEAAKSLAEKIPPSNNPKNLLQALQLKYRWQYTPDPHEIARINQLEQTTLPNDERETEAAGKE